MFILYYIIFFIILIRLIKNFRQTVLWYIPFRIALHQGIILWPQNPTVMLDSMVCFCIIIIYYSQYRNKIPINKFPFTFPLLLFSISEFLSGFVASDNATIFNFLQTVVVDIGLVYVLWNCIVSEKDISRLIKGYTVMFSLAILLGIFEQITHYNPIISIEKALLPASAPHGLIWVSEGIRFGQLFRSQAFMSISITFGGYCVIYFIFYYYFSNKYRIYNYFRGKKQMFYIIGLAFGTILSGSKSPILTLIVSFIPYFKWKWMHNFKLIILMLIVIPLTLPSFMRIYDDIYSSLTVENQWEYTGGSSLAMRMQQLEISYNAFLQSPIIGNGSKATADVAESNPELLGAESIWFKLLIEKGIVGIIAYFVLIMYPLFLRNSSNKKCYLALIISWMALNTMTTVPGMNISFYYTLIVILRKTELFKYRSNSNAVINNYSSF